MMTVKLRTRKRYRKQVRRIRHTARRRRSPRSKAGLLEQLLRVCQRKHNNSATDVVLRLINILGLVLIVLVIAVVGAEDNRQEIINLVKELFQLLH